MPTREQTLAKIQSRTKLAGDLPIFSASINRVRHISADPDSDAMALAQEIMKDANFSTKVLRLANSSYYNRGRGRIGLVSRAVVLLGFDTVKNITLTLKLIESFQQEHPDIDLNAMLVRSYLSAGFVQQLAFKAGVKDIEESYTCALLHMLGEIAVAYFLPPEYAEIQRLQASGNRALADVQQDVLGMSVAELSQELANMWEFPSTVVHSMGRYDPAVEGQARGKVAVNRALASVANKIVGSVYGLEHSREREPVGKLFNELASVTGIDPGVVQECLANSFKQSCDLAQQYGLDKNRLMPKVQETDDGLCDALARQFAYYASASRAEGAPAQTAPETGPNGAETTRTTVAMPAPPAAAGDQPSATGGDPNRQLALLQEITTLITESASLHLIFSKVVEGLQRGVGFDNALLCLVNRERTAYAARAALGSQAETLKAYFQFPIDPRRDLFSKTLLEGSELIVNNSKDDACQGLLPPDFHAKVGAESFAVAPLRLNGRPVGFFYADKSACQLSINEEEHRGFIHFIRQAKLALKASG